MGAAELFDLPATLFWLLLQKRTVWQGDRKASEERGGGGGTTAGLSGATKKELKDQMWDACWPTKPCSQAPKPPVFHFKFLLGIPPASPMSLLSSLITPLVIPSKDVLHLLFPFLYIVTSSTEGLVIRMAMDQLDHFLFPFSIIVQSTR